ncbi:MAG: hydroxyacylglutathione hydrolase [Gammaproteobacteria bacterium TMED104]|nr:MAG: hydroxyacylglutathione hydrolase [Gammaproteobacteria bacterium TMED104]|tara:strand:- start:1472 stop:2242 length:771 start_codon:yes stop_codon:yes gene_type:complete
MLKISPINAFSDNYIWLIQTNEGNTLVDPGDSKPIISTIDKLGITIDDILITHHHFDHIGGLELLKPLIKGSVIGPKNNTIDLLDKHVGEGDIIESIGLRFSVFEVPGHTLDHIAFYSETEKEVLFCGDTIFSGGCGRVFEGTFEQMNHSLEKLMSLPSKTEIYCAHEYTLSNLQFALMAEPDNIDLKEYELNSKNKREKNIPTIPTTLGQELQINPFLRVAETSLREAISDKLDHSNMTSNAEVFGFLRSWKDSL